MILLCKQLEVKNNTFINTIIMGNTAMECSACNQYTFTGLKNAGFIVQSKMKGAGKNADNFVVGMPMILHMISR